MISKIDTRKEKRITYQHFEEQNGTQPQKDAFRHLKFLAISTKDEG